MYFQLHLSVWSPICPTLWLGLISSSSWWQTVPFLEVSRWLYQDQFCCDHLSFCIWRTSVWELRPRDDYPWTVYCWTNYLNCGYQMDHSLHTWIGFSQKLCSYLWCASPPKMMILTPSLRSLWQTLFFRLYYYTCGSFLLISLIFIKLPFLS